MMGSCGDMRQALQAALDDIYDQIIPHWKGEKWLQKRGVRKGVHKAASRAKLKVLPSKGEVRSVRI